MSNLSLRYVKFYLDSSSTPIATQELQDINTNFANDRKWLYHATFNTGTLSTGAHAITAVATDVSGATQATSQSFTVGSGTGGGATAPAISSFTASPSSISSGGSSTLSWSASGATTLSINQGVGTVAGSSVGVTPAATTTYTVTATNSAGSASAAVTVSVVPAASVPNITAFAATPTSILSGANSQLSWSVQNATSLSINQSVGTVTGTSVLVAPSATTQYTLTATNGSGSATAFTTVTVTAGTPVTGSYGTPTSLAWPTVATACTLLIPADHSSSYLTSPLTSSATTIAVNSAASFVPCQVINIDSEQILISAASGTTLTVASGGRGFAGTTAATHTTNESVYGRINAVYRNQSKSYLISLEAAWLGVHGSGNTSLNGAAWDGHAATFNDLLKESDLASSTLTTALTTSATTLVVASASYFQPYNVVTTAGGEEVKICSVSGTTLTVCAGGRGWSNTLISAQPIGAVVTVELSSTYWNQMVNELVQFENNLFGNTGTTMTCAPTCTAGAGASWPNHAVTLSELGIASSSVVILSSAQARFNAELAALALDVSGTTATPAIAISPTSLTFPATSDGTPTSQTLTITNAGTATLTISASAIAGSNAADFAISGSCAATAAGGHCFPSVTFTPSLVGTESATLTFTDNAAGSPHTVSLSGTGTASTALAAGTVQSMLYTSSFSNAFTDSPTSTQEAWLAAHFQRAVAYTPYWDSKLSWFPNAWVYKDLYALYVGDALTTANPSWILKDASGNNLYIPYGCSGGTCPQYAADPGNAAFRAQWISTIQSEIAIGYIGAFVDDSNLTMQVGNGSGTQVAPIDPRTGVAMTSSAWEGYVAGFLTAIRAATTGKEIAQNQIWYASSTPGSLDPSVTAAVNAADYVYLQGGTSDPGLTGGTGTYSLNAFLTFVDNVHALGKKVILGSSGVDGVDGPLAGYLLINTGTDLYQDGNATPSDWWSAYNQSLGTATGARYTWNGLLRRDFTGGIVLLNPPQAATVTANLGGSYVNTSGAIVTSVVLASSQGAVLVAP